MEDKETSDKLLRLLGGLSQNDYDNTESSTSTNNNTVTMPNITNISGSILSQQNSVVSIPSALQRVIDLQNEQLGITDPQNDSDNGVSFPISDVMSRKRKLSDSTNSALSSDSSVSSVGSINKRSGYKI